MRKTLIVIACLAVLSLSACTGESKRPVATGKGGVRAINTISTAPNFLFLIEERTLAVVAYATGSDRTAYDDFEYIFNFEAILPDTILQQLIPGRL